MDRTKVRTATKMFVSGGACGFSGSLALEEPDLSAKCTFACGLFWWQLMVGTFLRGAVGRELAGRHLEELLTVAWKATFHFFVSWGFSVSRVGILLCYLYILNF